MKIKNFKSRKIFLFLSCICMLGAGIFIIGMSPWCKKVKTENGFGKIAQGDFSIVYGLSDKQRTELQNVYSNLQENGDMELLYADINADGTEELIIQEKEPAERERKRIVAVFAVTANGYERIMWDISDNTEYYFIANGKPVYYCFHSGIYCYSSYSVFCFDENWNENIEEKLEIFEITDLELYAECPDNWWNIVKPDVDVEGYYYRITGYEGDTGEEYMISADKWYQVFEKIIGETEKYGPIW